MVTHWKPVNCLYQPEKKLLKFNNHFTILCVDDNKMIFQFMVLQKMPKGFQIDIHYAKDGLVGLKKFEEMAHINHAYHIIFMDLHMEVMDGEESTKRIREYEKQHNLPKSYIVGLTADVTIG